MKRSPKSYKKKQANKLWSKKEKHYLIYAGTICFIIILLGYYSSINRSIKYENAYKAYENKEVPDSVVCMISNLVKPIATNPIMVQDDVYWGCCDRCLNRLGQNIGNVRFASDPHTGKKLKKSDAIIHINPTNKRTVLYFESNESYNNFLKQQKNS
ncbi:hypothetical protein [Carboxylicivirga sp. N1Y90]|uniref:hypothetical protein n=1 Tax=Carboxylicivirga fragile TaxID=3417571 RepID=UPI003D34964F|nr:hypothetical protein [Marinilabiliaceae bacterium N1Y90]